MLSATKVTAFKLNGFGNFAGVQGRVKPKLLDLSLYGLVHLIWSISSSSVAESLLFQVAEAIVLLEAGL
eukprot:1160162-Pelagomonas_calceolata.AAC.5